MTRCIHCTRCVRFGDEITGQQQLGSTPQMVAVAVGHDDASPDREGRGGVGAAVLDRDQEVGVAELCRLALRVEGRDDTVGAGHAAAVGRRLPDGGSGGQGEDLQVVDVPTAQVQTAVGDPTKFGS